MKVAFVVQRCGLEVSGGSEAECLSYAKLLKQKCDLTILTTCALDYMTWEDHYEPGESMVDGVRVQRFKVDEPRDIEKFNRFSDELFGSANKSNEDCEEWMRLQGPMSSDLLDYIDTKQDNYDRIVFFTYLYATTYFGVSRVREKDKVILVPTAHDEPFAHLPMWPGWYEQIQRFIFNTTPEKEFLERLLNKSLTGEVIGLGPELPASFSGIDFRQQYDLYSPYLLYVGRVDITKGAHDLCEQFIQAKSEGMLPQHKLVFVGKEVQPLPKHPDVVSLGFVSDETKFSAIEDCEVLINPSPFESLSIVLLEAWAMSKPVLVNAKCEVTMDQTTRFKGGAGYNDYEQLLKGIEICRTLDCSELPSKVWSEYSDEAITHKLLASIGEIEC